MRHCDATAHLHERMLRFSDLHAAPKIDLIETDLLNAQAITLRARLYHHNERVSRGDFRSNPAEILSYSSTGRTYTAPRNPGQNEVKIFGQYRTLIDR